MSRSPEARGRRGPAARGVIEAKRRTSAAHAELVARALRFACGSRRGGVDIDVFTDGECEWMAATADRLEESG